VVEVVVGVIGVGIVVGVIGIVVVVEVVVGVGIVVVVVVIGVVVEVVVCLTRPRSGGEMRAIKVPPVPAKQGIEIRMTED
jgi:hypothetical protein